MPEMKLADALEMAVRTDPGRIRSHNEDAVFADAGLGIAVLADGMGGYNAGEVASGMATTLLSSNFSNFIPTQAGQSEGGWDPDFVEQHIAREVLAANSAIFHAAERQPQYAGMGTTLVLAWFYDNRMSVAHVGDSRLYRWRDERFERLTKDHSLLQEQLDSGMITAEEARYSQNKNLVTRALGVDPDVDTEIHDYETEVGDIVLLCSDGLSDMVQDDEIALTLQTLAGNLKLAAEHLVQMANDHGGRDNISVILVKVRGDYSSPRGWWQRALARLQ
jgi:serine/threonine protein phosphatase PrpC